MSRRHALIREYILYKKFRYNKFSVKGGISSRDQRDFKNLSYKETMAISKTFDPRYPELPALQQRTKRLSESNSYFRYFNEINKL